MAVTNPTPEELSRWITEKIMGECWHERGKGPEVCIPGFGHMLVNCFKCGFMFNPNKEGEKTNKLYASDLNLAMKAVIKSDLCYLDISIKDPSKVIGEVQLAKFPGDHIFSKIEGNLAHAIALCLWRALEESK